ncbi:MAG: hypothetical protein MUE78_10060 [Ilumatobacteraceae bacterium]|nr:hypothetical protein [Ilumatobacteraceae bacterium]
MTITMVLRTTRCRASRGARDAGALLLPARERRRVAVEQLGVEAHQLGQLVAPGVDPGAVPAEQLGHRADVPTHRAMGEQADLLDHVPDSPAQVVRGQRPLVVAQDRDRSVGRLHQPVDHLERGGLAAAGRPHEGDHVALVDVERQVGDRR